VKKIALFIIPAILLLSGCATYKLQKGKAPYDQGYVFSRYDKIIPEYTLGKDNSVPDKQVAQERFKRRRLKVEYYYKKIGIIENRFKGMFIDPPVLIFKTLVGIFRMPAIAINDYRYNRDPKYKEKVDQKDEAEYRAEKERIKNLKTALVLYIQEDLKNEPASEAAPVAPAVENKASEPAVKAPPKLESVAPVSGEKPAVKLPSSSAPKVEAESAQTASLDTQEIRQVQQEVAMSEAKDALPVEEAPKPQVKIKPVKIKPQKEHPGPNAVIIAKPVKGPSPLKVQFSAAKSSVPGGRIVSYLWDFGDGDNSTKKNPQNTYWSATFGSRHFNALLTVKDDLGQTATSYVDIEVTSE